MPRSARSRPPSLAKALLDEVPRGEASAAEIGAAAEASFSAVPRAVLIPIDRITPNRDNPRRAYKNLDELAESIAHEGVKQTLLVRPDPEKPGHYVTIMGARRLLASRIVQSRPDPDARARVTALPCIIEDHDDQDAFVLSVTENVARDDLEPAELMDAVRRMQREFGWSAAAIASRIGRSKPYVVSLLAVGKDPELVGFVQDGLVKVTTAERVNRLPPDLRPVAKEGIKTGTIKTGPEVDRLARLDQERRARVHEREREQEVARLRAQLAAVAEPAGDGKVDTQHEPSPERPKGVETTSERMISFDSTSSDVSSESRDTGQPGASHPGVAEAHSANDGTRHGEAPAAAMPILITDLLRVVDAIRRDPPRLAPAFFDEVRTAIAAIGSYLEAQERGAQQDSVNGTTRKRQRS